MKVPIIKIGNSKGLRLPKSLLKRYNIKEEVELVFEARHILLMPIDQPRIGWEEAFEKIKDEGDDEGLIDYVFEDEDFEQWE